ESYNTVPGNPGAPTTVLGVFFPGGPIGSAAPYVPETSINYWDYPDNVGSGPGISPGAPAGYPVTVPSGGYIVVKIE
ncbi:MAG TPA: hypothetical protein DEB23_00180, partial [Chitinophagaceae bacterium]|nr:hypothetical protein [Chitinophagaceae bacterium]